MENKSCKICNSKLEVERVCKVCAEPTRLFCHTCGIMAEKRMHSACMMADVNSMLVQTHSH